MEIYTAKDRKPSHPEAAVCPRKFHGLMSPQKLQDLYCILSYNTKFTTIFGTHSAAGLNIHP
jgi:hypothetical protein